MWKQQLEQWFAERRQELIDDVCRLVRIDSARTEAQPGMPYGPGAAAALVAAQKLTASLGFETINWNNRVVTADLGPAERGLDILAHLDVVPAADDWKVTAPFEPIVLDGKLYGRGSADDKGPAVAAVYALRAVKELCVPLRKGVRIILGSDEECGSSDIEYYYSQETPAPMTFTPDADFPLINIEKGRTHGAFSASWTDGGARPRVTELHAGDRANVVPGKAAAVVDGLSAAEAGPAAKETESETGARFTLTDADGALKILCEGEGVHASAPMNGCNALTALLALLRRLPLADGGATPYLRALASLFPHGDWRGSALGIARHDELSGDTTVACTVLHLESGALRGMFDARTAIGSTKENTADVAVLNLAHHGLRCECGVTPEHHVPADTPLVQALLKCYEQYTGRKGAPIAIGGGTYVHELPSGVAFGCAMPGVDNRMHGADEFAIIDDLILSGEMFAQAIIDLCG